MKATLVIPASHAPTRRYRLLPRSGPRGSARGFRVSPSTICRILNGLRFQDLRDVLGARIETDDVEAAAAILHLASDDPGLVPLA